jgi:rhamnogalacturonan acetylesterase
MWTTSAALAFALATVRVSATPLNLNVRATPTIYLAGDSTMAKLSSPTDGTNTRPHISYTQLTPKPGWGQYLSKYVTVPVVNKAIGGRSARSFSVEGRFAEIEKLVTTGDIVIIEFGHNDGGSPNSASDNGRSDCPGTGSETCTSGKDGSTVYTFGHYVEAAARSYIARGASVVVSSQTPNNVWEGGKYNGSPARFVAYAAAAARNVGAAAGFVDHFQAVADMYYKLGSVKTNALYPKDHTHTSPEGADLVAQAFAQAVKMDFNGTTTLKQWLKEGTPVVF